MSRIDWQRGRIDGHAMGPVMAAILKVLRNGPLPRSQVGDIAQRKGRSRGAGMVAVRRAAQSGILTIDETGPEPVFALAPGMDGEAPAVITEASPAANPIIEELHRVRDELLEEIAALREKVEELQHGSGGSGSGGRRKKATRRRS